MWTFWPFPCIKCAVPGGWVVLYAKQELLGRNKSEDYGNGDGIEPVFLGGGTVYDTTYSSYDLLEGPDRFEVGVQNYAGQIAAGAAVRYLQQIGLDQIQAYENRLNGFLTEQLLNRYGETGWFRILGPPRPLAAGRHTDFRD